MRATTSCIRAASFLRHDRQSELNRRQIFEYRGSALIRMSNFHYKPEKGEATVTSPRWRLSGNPLVNRSQFVGL